MSVTLHARSGRWVARWSDREGRQRQRTFIRKLDAKRHEQDQVAERGRVKLEQYWADHYREREALQQETAGRDTALWSEIVEQAGGLDPVGWYVYLLWSRKGDPTPLYVGCSRNILSRLGRHLGDGKKRPYVGWVSLVRCASYADMFAREGALIRKFRPPWNKDIPPTGVPRMSKKTSIYLSDDRLAMIEASGKTIPELIDLGLDSLAGQDSRVTDAGTGLGGQGGRVTAISTGATGNAPAPSWGRVAPGDCKHPRARRSKGLCMACGTYIGAP